MPFVTKTKYNSLKKKKGWKCKKVKGNTHLCTKTKSGLRGTKKGQKRKTRSSRSRKAYQ